MPCLCLGALGALAGAAELPPTAAGGYTHFLVSERVNGVHVDFDTELAPVELGALVIRLRPSDHRLEILEHQLALGGTDGRRHRARVRARFQGEANLVANLEMGGVISAIEDHLVLPLQQVEIAGVIEIYREADSLRVITVENPEHVEIEIDSGLAGRLQLLCGGLKVITMGGLDCDALDQALSVVKVPLPGPGREFHIELADLTAEERRQIEEYLAAR